MKDKHDFRARRGTRVLRVFSAVCSAHGGHSLGSSESALIEIPGGPVSCGTRQVTILCYELFGFQDWSQERCCFSESFLLEELESQA